MEVAPELKNRVNMGMKVKEKKVIRDTPVGKTEDVED